MKLIDEWKQAYKLFSVQAMAIATAGLAAWMVLPEDLKSSLPGWVDNAAAIVILVCGVLGRLIDQKPADPEATAPGVK